MRRLNPHVFLSSRPDRGFGSRDGVPDIWNSSVIAPLIPCPRSHHQYSASFSRSRPHFSVQARPQPHLQSSPHHPAHQPQLHARSDIRDNYARLHVQRDHSRCRNAPCRRCTRTSRSNAWLRLPSDLLMERQEMIFHMRSNVSSSTHRATALLPNSRAGTGGDTTSRDVWRESALARRSGIPRANRTLCSRISSRDIPRDLAESDTHRDWAVFLRFGRESPSSATRRRILSVQK